VYHATHPADALTGLEDAVNELSLASGLALAALFAWRLRAVGELPAFPPEEAPATQGLAHR